MRLGKYELRSPVIKYVDVDLDEKIYNAIRASIGEQIAEEIGYDFDGDCNVCYCKGLERAMNIAKGQR